MPEEIIKSIKILNTRDLIDFRERDNIKNAYNTVADYYNLNKDDTLYRVLVSFGARYAMEYIQANYGFNLDQEISSICYDAERTHCDYNDNKVYLSKELRNLSSEELLVTIFYEAYRFRNIMHMKNTKFNQGKYIHDAMYYFTPLHEKECVIDGEDPREHDYFIKNDSMKEAIEKFESFTERKYPKDETRHFYTTYITEVGYNILDKYGNRDLLGIYLESYAFRKANKNIRKDSILQLIVNPDGTMKTLSDMEKTNESIIDKHVKNGGDGIERRWCEYVEQMLITTDPLLMLEYLLKYFEKENDLLDSKRLRILQKVINLLGSYPELFDMYYDEIKGILISKPSGCMQYIINNMPNEKVKDLLNSMIDQNEIKKEI